MLTTKNYNSYAYNPSAVNQYLCNDCNMDGMVSVADFNLFAPNLSAIGVFMVRITTYE